MGARWQRSGSPGDGVGGGCGLLGVDAIGRFGVGGLACVGVAAWVWSMAWSGERGCVVWG